VVVRKAAAWTVGVLILVVGIVVAGGYALPVGHVAARTASLTLPPDRVFAAITDVDAYPTWRSGLERVETLSRTPLRWREHGRDTLTLEVVETSPPSRLVTRIADLDLPFGGTWTYELAAEGGGTRITVTERGEVYNPAFRFLSRFVFGHTATIDQYLADLEAYSRRDASR
jgi:uncharacterized protein YndB with AHSA1/START domain